MPRKDKQPTDAAELRQRAEDIVRAKAADSPADVEPLTLEETRQALHELHVHQIELETQNEELRRTQLALDAAKTRYFDLYDLAPVGYVTVSEQGMILESNCTAATMLGAARSVLATRPFSRFVLKDDQDSYYLHRKQLFATSTPKSIELRMVAADSAVFWVRLDATAARDADGMPVCRVVMIDITARKQAESGLRKSEENVRAVFNATDESVFLLAADGTLLALNDVAAQRMGQSHEALIGRNVFDLLAPDVGAHRRPFVDRALLTGHPVSFEDERHGRWMANRLHPILDGVGRVVRLAIYSRDITERKLAETYREMGREILQILNEPGDLRESVRRVLDTLKTRTGFDAVGLRLQAGEDFPYSAQSGFPKDFVLAENTLIKRAAGGGVCRGKDGSVSLACTCGLVISGNTDPANPLFTRGGSFWTNDSLPLLDIPPAEDPRLHPRNQCIHHGYASVALIPIRNKDRIVGLIQLNDHRKGCFSPDSVEIFEEIAAHFGAALMRKQAEEALRESDAELKRSNKDLEQFAFVASHDLREPLRQVSGFVGLLERDYGPLFDERAHEYLDFVTDGARRMQALIGDLLEYSRVGRTGMAFYDMDSSEAVQAAMTNLQALVEACGAEITVENLPPVYGSKTLMTQIFQNLIGNALKFRSECDPRIRIDAQHQEGAWLFSVKDNGIGFRQEAAERIFMVFQRLHARHEYEGTGIGLAICKRAVERQGGRIWAESLPGEGATFYFTLPDRQPKE